MKFKTSESIKRGWRFIGIPGLLVMALPFLVEAQEDSVSIRFSVYSIGGAETAEVYYQPRPGIYEPVTFWPQERSPQHRYRGTLPIQFFAQEVTEEGEINYEPIAEATLKSRHRQWLFFFVPNPGSESKRKRFSVAVMGDSASAFPLNTVTFFNATGAELRGTIGKKGLELQEGVSAPIALNLDESQSLFVGLAVSQKQGYQPVLQNHWTFYPDYREVVILLPPKPSDAFRIQAYRLSEHRDSIRSFGSKTHE